MTAPAANTPNDLMADLELLAGSNDAAGEHQASVGHPARGGRDPTSWIGWRPWVLRRGMLRGSGFPSGSR